MTQEHMEYVFTNLKSWLVSSGLFISNENDKNCGGVYSSYDAKSQRYNFLYPEITGYFISTLRFLNNINPDEKISLHAKHASDWLIKIYEKHGSIIQGIKTDSENLYSYSFDSAIVAKGLLDYYEMTHDDYYVDFARKILNDLEKNYIEDNGTVKPFKNIQTNKFLESNDVWYKRKGCLHIKTSMPFFHIQKYFPDEETQKIANKICETISIYQNSDGSIRLHNDSTIINLHTLCYALEGLIYGYHVTKNKNYLNSCENAVNWCKKQIFDDGSIPLWFNSKLNSKAAYPVAQLIRIMILLDKLNSNSNYKSDISNLINFLTTFQAYDTNPKINGGFYEEFYKSLFGWRKRLRLNSWTSMFALQAIYWWKNYDKLSFENSVEFLY